MSSVHSEKIAFSESLKISNILKVTNNNSNLLKSTFPGSKTYLWPPFSFSSHHQNIFFIPKNIFTDSKKSWLQCGARRLPTGPCSGAECGAAVLQSPAPWSGWARWVCSAAVAGTQRCRHTGHWHWPRGAQHVGTFGMCDQESNCECVLISNQSLVLKHSASEVSKLNNYVNIAHAPIV